MQPGSAIKCQNCGALLTPTAATSGECEYCHAQVVARPESPVAAVNALRQAHAQRAFATNLKIAVVVVLAISTLIVVSVVRSGARRSGAAAVVALPAEVEVAPAPRPVVAAPTPPPIATPVLAFGEEGTNPGQLTGARAFAVMPTGEIVIAEVSTGRVQIFDATGGYLRVVNVPPSTLTKEVSMYGVGATEGGQAVVSRAGDLVVIDVAAGKVAKVIRGSYPDRYYTADVAVTPDGTIYAVTDRTGDLAITRVTLAGKVVGPNLKTNSRRFAIDGIGTLFLTHEFSADVEIRNAKGETTRRFSEGNPAHGKLSHPNEIAIDGRGHIFVEAGQGISVFTADGAFVADLDIGSVADLAVDRAGFLYVLSRSRVTKYKLDLPR